MGLGKLIAILSFCMQVHVSAVNEESEVNMLLQNEINLRQAAEEEINILRNQLSDSLPSEVWSNNTLTLVLQLLV